MGTKGQHGGECARRTCYNENAEWYNYGTDKHYCTPCARVINEANPEAIQHYGHHLCVHRPWVGKEIDVHPHAENVVIVEGDILDTPADYWIAHQCNCVSKGVSGVAKAIFAKWSDSNTYPFGNRVYGSYTLTNPTVEDPGIINLNTQYKPRAPDNYFEEIERLHRFYSALSWFLDNHESRRTRQSVRDEKYDTVIAMPYLIGSDLAGGDWSKYYHTVAALAKERTEVKFVFVKLPEKDLVKVKE